MRKSHLIILGLIAVSFTIAIYLYPIMPEQMASHWNAAGVVDDYMSKFWGLFLLPFFLVGILLLFMAIPKIDPLKANIEKFRKYFDGFIVLISGFLFYIYILTLLWNLGFGLDIGIAIMPAIGVIFYACGVLMEHAKQNWFIGIRTPWTLSSENVWNKTHKIGAKLFKISGIIAIAGFIFGKYVVWFVVAPVMLSAIYLIVYSYFEYQKEVK